MKSKRTQINSLQVQRHLAAAHKMIAPPGQTFTKNRESRGILQMNTARQQPHRLPIENAYLDFSRRALSMKDFLPEQTEGDHYHSDQWCFHLIGAEFQVSFAGCPSIWMRASAWLRRRPYLSCRAANFCN